VARFDCGHTFSTPQAHLNFLFLCGIVFEENPMTDCTVIDFDRLTPAEKTMIKFLYNNGGVLPIADVLHAGDPTGMLDLGREHVQALADKGWVVYDKQHFGYSASEEAELVLNFKRRQRIVNFFKFLWAHCPRFRFQKPC
jgi:hypothetical protein